MKCKKCNSVMIEISRESVMSEMPDDATDGQMADYIMAQESGDYGDWGCMEIIYKCEKCSGIQIIIED